MLSTISEMDPVLIAAAVIPAVILLLQVYRADRLEKEPTGLLISLLVFGVIATALAIVTETIGENILLSFFDETDLGYLILSNFIVVALSEEGFKLLLLRWRTWRSPNFNCQFDGVVYAVFVSLGFALWENIGYVAMYGFGTALVRAVTAVPGHACFGVFMGIWYGAARRYANEGDFVGERVCRRRALWLPVLTHGMYDFLASLDFDYSGLIFIVFIIVVFLAASRRVKIVSRNDRFYPIKRKIHAMACTSGRGVILYLRLLFYPATAGGRKERKTDHNENHGQDRSVLQEPRLCLRRKQKFAAALPTPGTTVRSAWSSRTTSRRRGSRSSCRRAPITSVSTPPSS